MNWYGNILERLSVFAFHLLNAKAKDWIWSGHHHHHWCSFLAFWYGDSPSWGWLPLGGGKTTSHPKWYWTKVSLLLLFLNWIYAYLYNCIHSSPQRICTQTRAISIAVCQLWSVCQELERDAVVHSSQHDFTHISFIRIYSIKYLVWTKLFYNFSMLYNSIVFIILSSSITNCTSNTCTFTNKIIQKNT